MSSSEPGFSGARANDRYALLSYGTFNLGDEVQSIAAAQFLPAIDLRIDRDELDTLPPGADGSYKIILNGWHSHAPERWPPGPFLDPLLTSIHITQEVFPSNAGALRPADILLRGPSLDFLRSHGPIGARDIWTRDLLRRHGVESFFSGCMTLTLNGAAEARRDYICAVDLPPPLLRRLRQTVKGPLVVRTHGHSAQAAFGERVFTARRQLSLYSQAKCVVTTRLHSALPCLAMGTPVLFINTAKDSYRFSGLIDFLHACKAREFLDGTVVYDIENPPPNSGAHTPYREALIEAANRFVGVSPQGPLHPFVPEPVTDRMLKETPRADPAGPVELSADLAFRGVFHAGRDYARDSRPDFLRDIARVHEGAGNRAEAERLLRIALQERPTGRAIAARLKALEEPTPSQDRSNHGGPRQRPQRPIVSAIRQKGRTLLSPNRLESLIEQASRVKARRVPGHFVEFGAGLGGSGICIASQLDNARQYWGFGSFARPTAAGQAEVRGDRDAPDACGQVAGTFAEFGLRVDGRTVKLVPGPFDETLPRHLDFPVAFAHLAVGGYDPVKFCLASLRPCLSRYGTIVVNDYTDQPECRRAVDEFMLEHSDMILEVAHTHAIILKT